MRQNLPSFPIRWGGNAELQIGPLRISLSSSPPMEIEEKETSLRNYRDRLLEELRRVDLELKGKESEYDK